jgi:hypothetical protein
VILSLPVGETEQLNKAATQSKLSHWRPALLIPIKHRTSGHCYFWLHFIGCSHNLNSIFFQNTVQTICSRTFKTECANYQTGTQPQRHTSTGFPLIKLLGHCQAANGDLAGVPTHSQINNTEKKNVFSE